MLCARPQALGCLGGGRAPTRRPRALKTERRRRARGRSPRRYAHTGFRGWCPPRRAEPRCAPALNESFRPSLSFAEQARMDTPGRRRLVQRIEVETGCAAVEEFATLRSGPGDAHLKRSARIVLREFKFRRQFRRDARA